MDDSLDDTRPNWASPGQHTATASPAEIVQGPIRRDTLGLDDTRPGWQHSQHQHYQGVQNTAHHGLGITTQLDASRPQPNASLRPASDTAFTTDVHKQVSDDQERIVAGHPDRPDHSQPMDFLKLISLWTTVGLPGSMGAGKEFVVEGPLSQTASKILGRGLSFEVMLVQANPNRLLPYMRSELVVYKALRGFSDQLDPIEKGELLRAALLEVRVLTHPPLKSHPNIVRFMQLIWETDTDLLDHAWPIIVLEYAEHGTLADFQETYPDTSYALKKQLCMDVGNGLLALHECGIVHGDLKSENVLICDADSGGGAVTAKLADFGCAVADLDPSDTMKLPAYTFPWNAPECHDRLPRDLLKYSDVYSYGLLVWRVMLNGVNPFRRIESLEHLDKTELRRQIEAIKMEDLLQPLAQATLRPPNCKPDVDIPVISDILELTLRRDAVSRNLQGALTRLYGVPLPSYPSEPLVPYNYEQIKINLAPSTMTPVSLQLSVIRELEAISSIPGVAGVRACLHLFDIYMARLEWPGAREKAAKWYMQMVKGLEGNTFQYYLTLNVEAVFDHLGLPVPEEIDPLPALRAFAADGCYDSLMELKRRSQREFDHVLKLYRERGGIMKREKKREIFKWLPFDDFEKTIERLFAEDRINISTRGSENGDSLLHAAARFCCVNAIEGLLALGADVDAVNDSGETALFEACRAGCFEAVELLVRSGADAGIIAHNGETVLHWVFTFDETDIERAVDILISNGAERCLSSNVEKPLTSVTEYMDLYGTPLHYAVIAQNEAAVRALLRKGADPFFDYENEIAAKPFTSTPFRAAIFCLLPNIVKIMLSECSAALMPKFKAYLESKKAPFLGTAADTIWSPLRTRCKLGRARVKAQIEMFDFLRTMESTDDVLKDPTKQYGISLLHACIVFGVHVDVIEHLLKTGCAKNLEAVSELREHTPLQAAIYLNRRETFRVLLDYKPDIHRRLQFPDTFSYLQYVAIVGQHAEYYARELVARGAVPEKMPDNEYFHQKKKLMLLPPALLALMTGNFQVARFFTNLNPSKRIAPPESPLVSFLLGTHRRLPVSRLRFLLEPPDGIEPASLNDHVTNKANCFHTLAMGKGSPELETRINFRYLLEQSKARGMHPQLLNQLNKYGMTPLTIAAITAQLELVREMLHAGADPNAKGFVTCGNAAHLGLQRIRKARNQPLVPQQGVTLTARESRWIEEDLKSIVLLSRQFGGEEPANSAGKPLMSISRFFKDSGWQGIKVFSTGFGGAVYQRYQAEQARKTRFDESKSNKPSPAVEESKSPNSLMEALSDKRTSFSDKLKDVKGYAKWLWLAGAEIDPNQGPSVRPLGTQRHPAPSLEPNLIAKLTVPQTTPVTSSPSTPTPLRPASIGPSPSIPQAPGSWTSSPNIHQQEAQSPETHIHRLTGHLSWILSRPYANPTVLHTHIQQSFDAYFVQMGANALAVDDDPNSPTPLGSFAVLELERGINNLLHRRGIAGRAVMLKREDGFLKVTISAYPHEPVSAIEGRARASVGGGWMTWRELEEKEAEILSRRLQDVL